MEPYELNRMFHQLSPTPEQEREMLERFLTEKTEVNPVKKIRRLTAVTVAAALLLIACAFTVMTGLDQRLLDYFGAEPEDTELLSSTAVPICASHTYENGWSVEISQVLADRSSVVVLINFTAPEGVSLPSPEREDEFVPDIAYSIHDPNGTLIRLDDGDTQTHTGHGLHGYDYLDSSHPEKGHVSMLWTFHIGVGDYDKGPTIYTMLGAEVTLIPKYLTIDSTGETIQFTDADWSCTFTLPETDPGTTYIIQQPLKIGEETVELSSVYLSPISFSYEFGTYSGSGEYGPVLYENGTEPYSIILADGTSIPMRRGFGHYGCVVGDGLAYDRRGRPFTGKDRIELHPIQFINPDEVVSAILFDQTFDLT